MLGKLNAASFVSSVLYVYHIIYTLLLYPVLSTEMMDLLNRSFQIKAHQHCRGLNVSVPETVWASLALRSKWRRRTRLSIPFLFSLVSLEISSRFCGERWRVGNPYFISVCACAWPVCSFLLKSTFHFSMPFVKVVEVRAPKLLYTSFRRRCCLKNKTKSKSKYTCQHRPTCLLAFNRDGGAHLETASLCRLSQQRHVFFFWSISYLERVQTRRLLRTRPFPL